MGCNHHITSEIELWKIGCSECFQDGLSRDITTIDDQNIQNLITNIVYRLIYVTPQLVERFEMVLKHLSPKMRLKVLDIRCFMIDNHSSLEDAKTLLLTVYRYAQDDMTSLRGAISCNNVKVF